MKTERAIRKREKEQKSSDGKRVENRKFVSRADGGDAVAAG